MNTPPQTPEAEVITRFLLRFADLMSTGSNAANLLLAAQLLDANMKRQMMLTNNFGKKGRTALSLRRN